MREDRQLKHALSLLMGEEVYVGNILQKHVLAKCLLASEAHKAAVNDIVHPAVARDFEQSGIDWLESAILFDSGFIHRTHFDYVVCVTAPRDIRIQRVMERDHISREKTLEWIAAQMPQEEVVGLSDFEIVNDGEHDIDSEVTALLASINEKYHK